MYTPSCDVPSEPGSPTHLCPGPWRLGRFCFLSPSRTEEERPWRVRSKSGSVRPGRSWAIFIAQFIAVCRRWGWTRKTGYNHITAVMKKAALSGPQATPKGLRHGYAVACIEKGIQLNIVQELLGHAQMTTTAIYAHAVGAEHRGIVARLWEA